MPALAVTMRTQDDDDDDDDDDDPNVSNLTRAPSSVSVSFVFEESSYKNWKAPGYSMPKLNWLSYPPNSQK